MLSKPDVWRPYTDVLPCRDTAPLRHQSRNPLTCAEKALNESNELITDIRNKSIKLLESDERWGVASKMWSISDNEHWVLVEAYQPFQLKKDGKTFKRGVIYGKLLSLQIYYQVDRTIKLDLTKVKPMYPYYKFGKVYTKKDNAPKK